MIEFLCRRHRRAHNIAQHSSSSAIQLQTLSQTQYETTTSVERTTHTSTYTALTQTHTQTDDMYDVIVNTSDRKEPEKREKIWNSRKDGEEATNLYVNVGTQAVRATVNSGDDYEIL